MNVSSCIIPSLFYLLQLNKMPNSGMLDHFTYQPPKYHKHWMSAWPSRAGYNTSRLTTSRFANFSRYLIGSNAQFTFDTDMGLSKVEPFETVSARFPRKGSNSISPFHTLSMKPTCGYYFSRETDNRKMRIGVLPSDLTAWRSVRPQTQHTHAAVTV